jgi:hypothetical protein
VPIDMQIGLDCPSPLADSGAMDKDIDPAISIEHSSNRRLERGLIQQIQRQHEVPVRVRARGLDLQQNVLAAGTQDNRRAALGKRPSDGLANPG